jgi:hypothetical protein
MVTGCSYSCCSLPAIWLLYGGTACLLNHKYQRVLQPRDSIVSKSVIFDISPIIRVFMSRDTQLVQWLVTDWAPGVRILETIFVFFFTVSRPVFTFTSFFSLDTKLAQREAEHSPRSSAVVVLDFIRHPLHFSGPALESIAPAKDASWSSTVDLGLIYSTRVFKLWSRN